MRVKRGRFEASPHSLPSVFQTATNSASKMWTRFARPIPGLRLASGMPQDAPRPAPEGRGEAFCQRWSRWLSERRHEQEQLRVCVGEINALCSRVRQRWQREETTIWPMRRSRPVACFRGRVPSPIPRHRPATEPAAHARRVTSHPHEVCLLQCLLIGR